MSDDNNIPPPEDPVSPQPQAPHSNEPQQDYSFDEPYEDPDESELNRKGSALGGNSGKALTVGFALLLGTGIILYNLFSESPPPPKINAGAIVPTKPSGEIVAQPATSPPASIGLPAPSAPSAPPAPPPPPPAPPPPPPPQVIKSENAPPPKPLAPLAPPEIKSIAQPATPAKAAPSSARLRSNMMLINGGSNTAKEEEKKTAKNALNKNDPNAQFASNAIEASSAETEVATKLTNLHSLIAQGKIINAVLETAINTDLPGTLRAIISRDVYAEAGKEILIPKGSRLIGTYNTGILRGQKRVLIVWTRVITPSGVDIQIGSPGVDSLGRAGVEGQVDNKYFEAFSAAFLTSAISVGVAIAADSTGNSSTTTNTDGSSTTSGSAGSQAANSTVSTLGEVSRQIVSSTLDLRPTITIDQGTRINVFVNKDLIMPNATDGGSMFVQ